MLYIPDESKPDVRHLFSYREVRADYERFCAMADDEFRAALPEALHLACFICYVKQTPLGMIVSDTGIVHLLAHALHQPESSKGEWAEMRKKFEEVLRLA